MSNHVWLSHPLAVDDPRPPAIPAPTLTPLYEIENDGAAVQTLCVASHTGTHVDAPQHVIEGGVCITEYSPEEFIFTKPVIVDLSLGDAEIVTPEHLELWSDALRAADIVLFRFGYADVRKSEPARFCAKCPGLGVEAARWLKDRFPNLRALGLDVPSLACIEYLDQTMTSHNELLGGEGCRFLVIEDMNLDMDLSGLREVRLNPWLVRGMDSGPCSVVGVMD